MEGVAWVQMKTWRTVGRAKRSRNDRDLLYFHDTNQAIPEWK